jgi:hypothetical protein
MSLKRWYYRGWRPQTRTQNPVTRACREGGDAGLTAAGARAVVAGTTRVAREVRRSGL